MKCICANRSHLGDCAKAARKKHVRTRANQLVAEFWYLGSHINYAAMKVYNLLCIHRSTS